MKTCLRSLLLLALFCSINTTYAAEDKRVSHVIVVWLKEPGDAQMREKFITASRALENLPGVISRHVSAVIPSTRPKVDSSFDVAVTVTFENADTLKKYMQDPRHKLMLDKQLKPIVDKVVIYNFGNI